MDTLLQLQLDLAAKIASEAYFQHIAVATYRSMVVSAEIAKRLPFIAGKNGKIGCGIIVNMPEVINTYANVDPPVSEFSITADVIENPELNFLPGTGTQLTCEEVARQVRMIFNLFAIGLPAAGSLYAPDQLPVIAPLPDIHAVYPGCCGYRVIAKLQIREPQQTRTAQPTLSANAYVITLTNNSGGATIYYTVDGSFPGPGNAAAEEYTGDFTVSAGVTVRFAAYLAGSLGSNVGCYIAT